LRGDKSVIESPECQSFFFYYEEATNTLLEVPGRLLSKYQYICKAIMHASHFARRSRCENIHIWEEYINELYFLAGRN
jgi:hypothetical protein